VYARGATGDRGIAGLRIMQGDVETRIPDLAPGARLRDRRLKPQQRLREASRTARGWSGHAEASS